MCGTDFLANVLNDWCAGFNYGFIIAYNQKFVKSFFEFVILNNTHSNIQTSLRHLKNSIKYAIIHTKITKTNEKEEGK